MRFYDSPSIERIGFDFYCDIANNIVKLREENGFTQKDLAVKTGIKEYRISNMENVKIRIDLDAVEELAKALNVSADYLIDAELDCGGKECLYQVWLESEDRFKLYIRASSKRMAFLKFDKKFSEISGAILLPVFSSNSSMFVLYGFFPTTALASLPPIPFNRPFSQAFSSSKS